ncbi:DUF5985 family protein [Sphingomonas sp. MG17]|uniref:DUF5985 family protein n=1 Tax=Sphingomonas tagetis TaxID=2949092 RepID=A0A9X2HWA2_9SPHN|nr:DUF5985 family protein [Sphingomonas tagetis]MCP3733185.1 DUF5985 family protein [Sphingomonas tagetis]
MMLDFLSGVIAMGCFVAGLFFLRFWKKTRERLFLAFAFAFWLLALAQTLLAVTDFPIEERGWLYFPRLVAFVLILISIWWKNRRPA